jgi:hypothetical protein
MLRPGRGVNHPPSPSVEVKERIKLHVSLPVSYFTVWYRVKEGKNFLSVYDTD